MEPSYYNYLSGIANTTQGFGSVGQGLGLGQLSKEFTPQYNDNICPKHPSMLVGCCPYCAADKLNNIILGPVKLVTPQRPMEYPPMQYPPMPAPIHANYCLMHGPYSGGLCPYCTSNANKNLQLNKGEKEMAKRVLTSDQKSAIVYARAKGLSEPAIMTLYMTGKLTAGYIDEVLSFGKLVEAYDPAEEEDEKDD